MGTRTRHRSVAASSISESQHRSIMSTHRGAIEKKVRLQDAFIITLEFLFTIFLWCILLLLMVPLAPLWLPIVAFRRLEQWVCERYCGWKRMDSDAVFWMLDTPKNKSIINAAMVFHEMYSVQRLQKIILQKMVNALNENGEKKYPNVQKYIRNFLLNFYWCKDDAFDIHRHIYAWNNNIYQSKEDMQHDLNRVAVRPFVHENESSPWEFVFFYYTEEGMTKTCIMMRCHHSLADGMSFVNFIVNKLGDEVSQQVQPRAVPASYQLLLKAKGTLYMPYTFLKIILASHPRHDLHCTKVTGKKRYTWSPPVSMRLIKAIKQKLGVSVNDVLVGCISTNFHRHFKDNEKTIPQEIMAGFPFSTRYSLKEAETFSNKFAVVFLPLSTRCDDAVDNILDLSSITTIMKYSGQHHGMRLAARVLNILFPFSINEIVFNHLSSYSSMVLSNVPGPQTPLRLDGSPVEMCCFWPPQKNHIGMAASMLSYNGELRIAVCCDDGLKTNPHELVKRFPEIFNSLAKTVGVEDLHYTE